MNKIRAGQVIHSLAQACARGSHCFENVPDLIINIIKNNLWKNFIVEESDKEISYEKFEEFISAPAPEGLETTMKTLENLCRDNTEALSLLTNITKKPRGRPKKKVSQNIEPENIEIEPGVSQEEPIMEESQKIAKKKSSLQKIGNNITNKSPRPEGTSRAKGYRRLESQRPDLHKKVLDGELTVHKAMLEAGFRKLTFTISIDPESAANTIANNYQKDDIKKLIEELQKLI